tara:strand:- start:3141 stop:4175 length:1035 start_codon:yes stop_codon:yes gene_type:complete
MKVIKSKKLIQSLSVSVNTKIINIISKLEKTKNKFLLVVDKNNFFLGVINDGDIRRGLLKGFSTDNKIQKIYNRNSFYLKKKIEEKKIENIFYQKQIHFFPIIKNKKIELIYISNSYSNPKIENKLVIMAGGKGLRLKKFTKKIPKPMLKIKGKPILEHLIENSKNQGIHNYIITINYLASKITKYFGNGNNRNIKIKYIKEKNPLGTAGSLFFLKNEKKDLIITNADLFTEINYLELLNFHKKNKSDFTVVIKKLNWSFPYGSIKYNNFRLVKLDEKPMYKTEVIAGVYVVNPKVLKELRKLTYLNITDLISKLVKLKKKVFVYPIYENWTDIGSYNEYLKIK